MSWSPDADRGVPRGPADPAPRTGPVEVAPGWHGWAPVPPVTAPAPAPDAAGARTGRGRGVTVAAVGAALVVSVGVAAVSVAAGRDTGAAVVPPVPTTTAALPDAAPLEREVGRLAVDLAVARATWTGAAEVGGQARADLGRAIDDAQEWLDAYRVPATESALDRLLRELATHREALSTLVAEVGRQGTPDGRPVPVPQATPAPQVTPVPARPAPRAPSRTPAPSRAPAAPVVVEPEPVTDAPPAPPQVTAPVPEPTGTGGTGDPQAPTPVPDPGTSPGPDETPPD